ncbi:MAG: DUF3667 domain-containing protein [Ferruginibacter sp.]
MGEPITCKNCGNPFTGKFCNNCGEKVYTDKDRSVSHLLSEGVHFITHFEGSFFKTVAALFTKPGKFSLDYCDGVRKKYFKPLAFFLLLVVIYLLFPFFDGLNSSAYYHIRHPFYGKYALRKSLQIVQEGHLTDEAFGQAFSHASEKTSKLLLFIIIPAMALFSWLISFKKRKYFYDNFVFSIEANSFFLLWGFLIFPLLFRLFAKFVPVSDQTSNLTILIADLSFFTFYLVFAAKRFFQFKWWYSILYSLLFTFLLAIFIQYIYKFISFYIAIHLI